MEDGGRVMWLGLAVSYFPGWCSVTMFQAVSDGAVLPPAGSFADGSRYFVI